MRAPCAGIAFELIASRCFEVDPYKESGQNMYRQYAHKKNKIVLSAQWIHECIKMGRLQTYQDDWAGCEVTGNEE